MLSEELKINAAIYPRSVSSSGTTSIYFDLSQCESATFIWDVVQTGLTATSTGLVYQATDEDGTSAAAITATSTVLSMTSNLTEATITPSISAGETNATVTINDLIFTVLSSGSTAVVASRYVVGNTANVSTTITNLAAAINDVGYGVPGVRAVAGSAALTLKRDEGSNANTPIDYSGIVLTSSNTTNMTLAGVHMQGIIEIQANKLTLSSNFTHVALNVINVSANYTSAVIIRKAQYRKPAPPCPITQV
jgi:hypothetical protein